MDKLYIQRQGMILLRALLSTPGGIAKAGARSPYRGSKSSILLFCDRNEKVAERGAQWTQNCMGYCVSKLLSFHPLGLKLSSEGRDLRY